MPSWRRIAMRSRAASKPGVRHCGTARRPDAPRRCCRHSSHDDTGELCQARQEGAADAAGDAARQVARRSAAADEAAVGQLVSPYVARQRGVERRRHRFVVGQQAPPWRVLPEATRSRKVDGRIPAAISRGGLTSCATGGRVCSATNSTCWARVRRALVRPCRGTGFQDRPRVAAAVLSRYRIPRARSPLGREGAVGVEPGPTPFGHGPGLLVDRRRALPARVCGRGRGLDRPQPTRLRRELGLRDGCGAARGELDLGFLFHGGFGRMSRPGLSPRLCASAVHPRRIRLDETSKPRTSTATIISATVSG